MVYLTFNRQSRDLILHSDKMLYAKNIDSNDHNIVRYDQNVIVQKFDNFEIETYYKEAMQTEILVPGQKTLEDEVELFVSLYETKALYLEKGKVLFSDKLKKVTGGVPLAYTVYLTQIDQANPLFKVQTSILGGTEQEAYDIAKKKGSETMARVNSLNTYHEKFRRAVKNSTDATEVQEALKYFNTVLTELILPL